MTSTKRTCRTSGSRIAVCLVCVAIVTLSAAASAQDREFEDAEVFFELNDTDGDLGLHGLVDGGPWRWLTIAAPGTDLPLLDISAKGSLRVLGMTELAFESNEPPFDQLTPDDFFARFPEGIYTIDGSTLAARTIRRETEVSHTMPAPPTNLRVNDLPLPEDCDEGSVPVVLETEDIFLAWDPVETTHEDLGSPRGSKNVEIELYEIVIEQEHLSLAFEWDASFDPLVFIPRDLLSPAGLLEPAETKVEVLVREASHNQTATEGCFLVGP